MTTEQYKTLIDGLVTCGCPSVPGATVTVEQGTVLADALMGRPVAPMGSPHPDVPDAAGHRRPVYRPLLVYAHVLARADGMDPWLASLEFDPDVPFTAANGPAAAAAVWSALTLHLASVEVDAPRLFRRLVEGQQPNGALLRTTASDNPETHWYHELVILHAVTNYALSTGNPSVWSTVERATAFHLNETETDHATGQPWGLPAFVRVAGADPLADAVLHAVAAHQPAGAAGVPLLLLADTLYGLVHAPDRAPSETDSR